ncbi:KIF-binding protein-like isoform X2 [Antedon mediterranea]|uniref:KIF-binding protein-like isoform X2 n=1 Tax=Antedon mediterranea TaxID=105859 RepID=UPI003AF7545A
MSTFDQFRLASGCKQYLEARHLSEELSQHDPETEPFKSKYKAREVLAELKKSLSEFSEQEQQDFSEDVLACEALLEYQLAVNYIDTTEVSTGEEHLKKVEKMLQDKHLSYQFVSLLLNTLNQMAILWNTRNDNEKALQILLNAQDLYNKYKNEVDKAPIYIHELLDSEEKSDHERWQEFEKVYTHTLYYLAQVYGAQNENHKSASYCQITLQRQLKYDQYEPLEWALNCATLSQYYICQSNYTQARHCLDKGEKKTDEDEEQRRLEDIANREADLYRCWTKYCISLLQDSREKLLVENADETRKEKQENDDDVDENKKLHERFESLELTSLESEVTDQYVTVFEEARCVFLAAQKWIGESKRFYEFDGFVSENIEIVKDHSTLFKLLAFFELDPERKCKMYKRRVDMLQNVIKQLNPQHFLLLCRQLIFESAEIYSEMVDFKISIAEEAPPASQHAVKKINMLIMNSIGQYQAFINSLRKPDETMPDTLEEDVVRPAMVAYFCMGRLYSKLIGDPRNKVENLRHSVMQYKEVVDYCKRHPDVKRLVEAELDICEEMVQLLPARIDQLISGFN